MTLRIDIHHYIELGAAESLLRSFNHKLESIMIDTTKIRASVAQEITENASLRALVNGAVTTMADLAAQLATAIAALPSATDTAALVQVQTDLDQASTDLDADDADTAAAIAAGTPAAAPVF